jgi:hypothetical protein
MDSFIDEWYDKALADGQGFKSEAERKAYFDGLGDPEDHPMFATNAEQLANHPWADAFRALREEDKTQYEIMIMYKEEANELMKRQDKKGLQEAIAKYTHALSFVEPAITELREQQNAAAQLSTSTTTAAGASVDAAAAAAAGAEDVLEVKSASVLQFERDQREFSARRETEQIQAQALSENLARARLDPSHVAGTKPLKLQETTPVSNPELSFAGDKSETEEEREAKKTAAIKGMEGHAGEKVLTFDEIRQKALLREEKIRKQAVGATLDTLQQTRSQILGNRAFAQLTLKNYGMCIKDCDVALYFWSRNIKAYYRKCKALQALHRYELCVDAYNACRKACIDDPAVNGGSGPTPADLKSFAEVEKVAVLAKEQLARIDRDRRQVLATQERRRQEITQVYEICTGSKYRIQLGIPPGKTASTPIVGAGVRVEGEGAAKKNLSSNTRSYVGDDDDDDEDVSSDAKSSERRKVDAKYLQQLEHQHPFVDPECPSDLRFPTIFLYPQHNQLDIVQGAGANNMLAEYLAQMFPEIEDPQAGSAAPWDYANEYVVSKLICYVHLNGCGSRVESAQEWLSYYDAESKSEVPGGRSMAFDKEQFCQLHLGCTIGQILACDKHIVPGGLLHVLVFVNQSKTHKRFLQTNRKNRSEMYTLAPNGSMKLQL